MPAIAVGAVGVPVKVGEAILAFKATEATVASALKSWSPVLIPMMLASLVFSVVVKSLLDKSLPVSLSTFNAKLLVRSVAFAFKATEATVASALKSWSPVLVPVIDANFVFSAVV